MPVDPDERKALLDDAVADVLREGGRIESEAGFTAVVFKRNRLTAVEHALYVLGCVVALFLIWPVALLVIGVWVWSGVTRKVRYSLTVDEDGELEQTVLGR